MTFSLDDWDTDDLESDEKLFVDSGPFGDLACAGYDLTDARYSVSFEEAAEVLTRNVLDGGLHDLLVFPILYCHRHWLELELKRLIVLGARWRGMPPEPVGTHDLRALWDRARPGIEAAFPDDDPAILDRVGAIIDELADVDPRSESFRYSRDRAGNINVPDSLQRVNVRHVAHVMRKLRIVLGGAADGMGEMLYAADVG